MHPAIAIWNGPLLNQGTSVGISRATLVVRVGALKSLGAKFLARIPPSKVKGMDTNRKSARTEMSVPNGKAIVEPWANAMELTMQNTTMSGRGKRILVNMTHRDQFFPLS